MSSCNKNCSCNRCKSRLKPRGVVPVSKAIKAIDVCQIPPKECDCSGMLNYRTVNFVVTANICPNCNLQDSSFSFELLDPNGLTINSTILNVPRCNIIENGTVLEVTGFGTLEQNQIIFPINFTLSLIKKLVGSDEIHVVYSYVVQDGTPLAFQFITAVEGLSINFCTS